MPAETLQQYEPASHRPPAPPITMDHQQIISFSWWETF